MSTPASSAAASTTATSSGAASSIAPSSAATAGRVRPVQRRPFPLVRHSLALMVRSLIKLRRTPEQLFDVVATPVLFMAIFVYVFGGAISGSPKEYLQFVVPGLLAQMLAFVAVPIGINLNTDITKGIFDRFRALPIPRAAPLVGAVMGDIVRYATTIAVTLGFGLLVGFRITTSIWAAAAAVALALLFALCMSWISVWFGLIARTPGAVSGILYTLIMPLTFASTIFVPAATLPGWLQGFVRGNPLTHLVEALRGLLTGGPVSGPLAWTLVWCVGFVLVFMPLALRAYRRRT